MIAGRKFQGAQQVIGTEIGCLDAVHPGRPALVVEDLGEDRRGGRRGGVFVFQIVGAVFREPDRTAERIDRRKRPFAGTRHAGIVGGVDHRLTAHGFAIPVVGDIDGGEDLQVGTPFDGGAGARLVGGLDLQGLLLGANDLTLLEVQLILVAVTPYGDVHVLGGVLRGARAQAVGAQREVVVAALVVVVFTARVQLAEHQLPVEALLGGVPVKRAAAAVVLHLNGAVGEGGEGDQAAVALTRLVDRVRQDLERGMSAAIQAVGAEYDRRAKAYAFLVLQLADAVVAIIDRAFCHTVLSLLVFPLWCIYRKLPQGLPAPQQHHGKNIVHLFAD